MKRSIVFVTLVMLLGANAFSVKKSKNSKKFFRVAHRACSLSQKKITENSENAIKRALEYNKKNRCIDGIEFDVRMTKDRKIVAIHDENLKRVAGSHKKLSELTSHEIKELRLKDGQKIAFLKDIISVINNQVIACIELKTSVQDSDKKVAHFVSLVFDEIKSFLEKGWGADRFVLLSLDQRVISEAKKIMQKKQLDLETGILFDSRNKQSCKLMSSGKFVEITQNLGADYAIVYAPSIKAQTIKEAKSKGVALILYPINSKKQVVKYKKMGIRGFGSDFLECLKAVN